MVMEGKMTVKRNYKMNLMSNDFLFVEFDFGYMTVLQLFELLGLDVPEVLLFKSGFTLAERPAGFANGA